MTDRQDSEHAPKPRLILASGSPRRRELLARLGVSFTVMTADIDEVSAERTPQAVARDLAEQKARAVAARLSAQGAAPEGALPETVIIASDTLVALDGDVLGKPRDRQQNLDYLRRLSGETHRVHSGVAVLRCAAGQEAARGNMQSGVQSTDVTFRRLSPAETAFYADSGEGLDKAGGYGIQGLGMALVADIHGDYSSVVGFPLALVISLLRGAGVPVWGEREGA